MTETINGRAAHSLGPSLVPIDVPGLSGVDWQLVAELRNRVSTRLATAGEQFGPDERREWSRQLIRDEYGQWLAAATRRGIAVPGAGDEARLFAAVMGELDGMGRIAPIAARGDVEDIRFIGCDPTVLRLSSGEMVSGPPLADTDEELTRLLRTVGARFADGQAARELSASNPVLNVRLRGIGELGARLAAAIDILPRPSGVIRIHRFADPSLESLGAMGMLDTPMRLFLQAAIDARLSILVSGLPGVGKTTMLRALGNAIDYNSVVLTIEDERELGLHLPRTDPVTGAVTPRFAAIHPFEARPANSEGRGAFTMSQVTHEALRWSPQWVILGEVRGAYVMHLLDAAVSGVSSIMCTIHAKSAASIFDKVLINALKTSPAPSTELVMRSLAEIDLVVHVTRDRSWTRFVSGIYEIGKIGDSGRPDLNGIFVRRGGAVRPTSAGPGRLSEARAELLSEVGFEVRRWLDPAASTWQAAAS